MAYLLLGLPRDKVTEERRFEDAVKQPLPEHRPHEPQNRLVVPDEDFDRAKAEDDERSDEFPV